jgi:hypothetical protein
MAVPVALEAYKARGRARIVLWGVAGLFGFAGFVWPFLKDGLPTVSAKLAELATNPTTWFALAIAVFFVLRPLWTKSTAINSTEPAHSDNAQIQELIAEVAKLQEEASSVKEVTVKIENLEITAKQQSENMTRAITHLGELQETATNLAVRSAEQDVLLHTHEQALDEARAEVTPILAELRLSIRDLEKRANNLRLSFVALDDKRRLEGLEIEMEKRAKVLSLPSDEGANLTAPNDWAEWRSESGIWFDHLSSYVEIGSPYCDDLASIKEATTDQFERSWSIKDEQFPDSDAVWRYKRYRIIYHQWEVARKAVSRNVFRAAYYGEHRQD